MNHATPDEIRAAIDAAFGRPDNPPPPQLGRDDLASMSAAEIEKARVAGQLDDLLKGAR